LNERLGVIADASYRAVELAAPEPEVLGRLLRVHGLRHAGPHTVIISSIDPGPTLRLLEVTGGRDVCKSGLLRWGDDLTVDDYCNAIRELNELGRRYREHGIHFHNHHHVVEFQALDGALTGWDLLDQELDFSVVDFCIDVAWVVRGGQDPAALLQRLGNRVGYVHLKATREGIWTPLGQGSLNWTAILDVLAKLPSVRWAMVEQDFTE
jgi:sugar phosphate isomerase/epimerase